MPVESLTIQLPINEIEFLQRYTEKHKITISELINCYARYLQESPKSKFHPDIGKITGIIPENIDIKEEYYKHSIEKHL